ncbi:MAG: tetratricopeptide repeat protein [Saprospiraceae bacterium]|nr:tetratricopeptide repeat protein [Saprospiraceae bacterium]
MNKVLFAFLSILFCLNLNASAYCKHLLTANRDALKDTSLAKNFLIEASKLGNSGQHQLALFKLDTAELFLGEVLSYFDSLLYAKICQVKGDTYTRIQNLGEAMMLQEKALKIRTHISRPIKRDIAESWYSISNIYLQSRKIDEAKNSFNKAINYYYESDELDSVKIANCWLGLGRVLRQQDSFYTAKVHFKKGSEFLNAKNSNAHWSRVSLNFSYAECCIFSGDMLLADTLLMEAQLILSKFEERQWILEAQIFSCKALLESQRCNYDLAIKYSLEGLNIYKTLIPPNSPLMVPFYVSLGALYFIKDDSPKAKEYLEKGIELSGNSTQPNDLIAKAQCTINLAGLFAERQEHEKAIAAIQQALTYLSTLNMLNTN